MKSRPKNRPDPSSQNSEITNTTCSGLLCRTMSQTCRQRTRSVRTAACPAGAPNQLQATISGTRPTRIQPSTPSDSKLIRLDDTNHSSGTMENSSLPTIDAQAWNVAQRPRSRYSLVISVAHAP